MGNELRSGEVTTATASITEYARYCELRDAGAHRRGGRRAEGDRGLQPLRLPLDAPAAGLADGPRHRFRGAAARPGAACGRRGPSRGDGRPADEVGTRTAEVRRRRHRGAHRRADRGRDVGRRQGFSQARGQAVLVGALRPGQQSGRRMGRRRRRVHRREPRDRHRLAHTAAGAQAPAPRPAVRRDRHRRADPGHVRALRPALAARAGRRSGPARVRLGDGRSNATTPRRPPRSSSSSASPRTATCSPRCRSR